MQFSWLVRTSLNMLRRWLIVMDCYRDLQLAPRMQGSTMTGSSDSSVSVVAGGRGRGGRVSRRRAVGPCAGCEDWARPCRRHRTDWHAPTPLVRFVMDLLLCVLLSRSVVNKSTRNRTSGVWAIQYVMWCSPITCLNRPRQCSSGSWSVITTIVYIWFVEMINTHATDGSEDKAYILALRLSAVA